MNKQQMKKTRIEPEQSEQSTSNENVLNDDSRKTYMLLKADVWVAVILELLLLLFFVIFLVMFIRKTNFAENDTLKNFLHFGPSKNMNVWGAQLNTWSRWTALMIFLIVSDSLGTYTFKVYSNWYSNVIANPKVHSFDMSKSEALLIINLFKIVTWIPSIFRFFLTIVSRQLQFLLPGFIARRVVNNIIDVRYINDMIPAKLV